MASRTLDDIEELLVPAAFVAGGLYLLYWVTKSTTQAVTAIPATVGAIVDYDAPFVGEGDFIDRWTYNPGEIRRDVKRLTNWVTGAFR